MVEKKVREACDSLKTDILSAIDLKAHQVLEYIRAEATKSASQKEGDENTSYDSSQYCDQSIGALLNYASCVSHINYLETTYLIPYFYNL